MNVSTSRKPLGSQVSQIDCIYTTVSLDMYILHSFHNVSSLCPLCVWNASAIHTIPCMPTGHVFISILCHAAYSLVYGRYIYHHYTLYLCTVVLCKTEPTHIRPCTCCASEIAIPHQLPHLKRVCDRETRRGSRSIKHSLDEGGFLFHAVRTNTTTHRAPAAQHSHAPRTHT